MSSRILRILEIITLCAGVALLGFYCVARMDAYFASHAAIASFEAAAAKAAPPPAPVPASGHPAPLSSFAARSRIDFSLWSPSRIFAYRQSLEHDFGQPLALLRIARIHLTVPVFDGTDELTLNRGVGRIADTALPGQPGNVGIAGHRDGFFRGLKDVARGDVLQLVLPDRTDLYAVDKIEIVSPEDVGVLARRATPALTLVTCYPFYYLGSAPKRYVVEASLQGQTRDLTSTPTSRSLSSQGENRK